jgi:hypothetical protein
MSGLAAAAFIETPAGRRLYLDRVAELHTNLFKVPVLTARVDELAGVLRRFMHSDWDFESRVSLLKSRLAARSGEIGEQLAGLQTPVFDERNEASLARLNFDVGRRDFFRGGRGRWRPPEEDFPRAFAAARAVVMLEPGRYRFQARVRAEVDGRAVGASAVALSSSAGGESRRLDSANGWAVLQHEFTLKERDYVVLKYQFEGPDGPAAFDRSSLKLIRSIPNDARSRSSNNGRNTGH